MFEDAVITRLRMEDGGWRVEGGGLNFEGGGFTA
jgi:hypothetical protein